MPKTNSQIVPKFTVPTILTVQNAPMSPIVGSAEQALDFIGVILESSQETISKAKSFFETKAHDISYGYQSQEVVRKGNDCQSNTT